MMMMILLILSVQKHSQQISVFCTFGGPITHGAPRGVCGRSLITSLTTSVYQFLVNVIITHIIRTFSLPRQTTQHQVC